MNIIEYRTADLRRILFDDCFWKRPVIPITRHRALSYINNPRADDDDVVLLVAYNNDTIAGYIGILPDYIYADDLPQKIGWLSAWWVDPPMRPSGIGSFLLFKAIKSFNQYVAGINYNRASGEVFQKVKHIVPVENQFRYSVVLALSSEDISRKLSRVNKTANILFKPPAAAYNIIQQFRYNIWLKKIHNRKSKIRIEYCDNLDVETDKFINEYRNDLLTRRGVQEFNWILRYPWILQAPVRDIEESYYQFLSTLGVFRYISFKVYNNDELIAYILLKHRDTVLDVSYIFYRPEERDSIIYILFKFGTALRVHEIYFYDKLLCDQIKDLGMPYVRMKSTIRKVILPKKITDTMQDTWTMQGGEGESVFT